MGTLIQLVKIAFISLLFWGEDEVFISFARYFIVLSCLCQTSPHVCSSTIHGQRWCTCVCVHVWVLFSMNSNSRTVHERNRSDASTFSILELKRWSGGLKFSFLFGWREQKSSNSCITVTYYPHKNAWNVDTIVSIAAILQTSFEIKTMKTTQFRFQMNEWKNGIFIARCVGTLNVTPLCVHRKLLE